MFRHVAAEPPALSHCLCKQTTGDKNINRAPFFFYGINRAERDGSTPGTERAGSGSTPTRSLGSGSGTTAPGAGSEAGQVRSSIPAAYINHISEGFFLKKVSILSLFYFPLPDNIIPLSHSHRLAAFIRFFTSHSAPPPPPHPPRHSI